MTSKIAEMQAMAALENDKARRSWGLMYHSKHIRTHAERLLDLSKNAKRVDRMLKRGRTLDHIAKQMGSSKQTVGQLISIYKLPREE
jgi:DNA-binding NarL/FixJ family response regulator